MFYSKTNQTTMQKVNKITADYLNSKTRTCPNCGNLLPKTSFTSSRAKMCNSCKIIKQLTQKQEMTARALGRSQNKKQKKEQVLSIADLKKSVQREVNKYVRLRDKDLRCISCGVGQVEHAGHYIAQGSSGLLRFDEKNLNGQCRNCNVWKHGNLIGYRIGLVKKYGEEVVKNLEDKRFETWKWTREELENLLTTYKEKIKNYEN